MKPDYKNRCRCISAFLALSVVFNAVYYVSLIKARSTIASMESQHKAEIEQAERVRDMALQQLGELAMQIEREQRQVVPSLPLIEDDDGMIYIGECTVTAYCPCEKCCGQWSNGITATGTTAQPGVIAVDPSVIPLGSKVVIDGAEYSAEDTGGAIKGYRIDLYMDSHSAALEYGVQNHDVWVVNVQ